MRTCLIYLSLQGGCVCVRVVPQEKKLCFLDPTLLLGLRGKAKVITKLKLVFFFLLHLCSFFPMLRNRLLGNGHTM